MLVSGDGLEQLARWLRRYHDAVADFVPPPGAAWVVPGVAWRRGQIVRDGDLGPWNSVWRDSRLAGLIDWDLAEPGTPLEDVAQLAWYAVPLRGPQSGPAAGLPEGTDPRARLDALCRAYSVPVIAVLDGVDQLIARETSRLRDLGAAGTEPWSTFRERGDEQMLAAELQWVHAARPGLAT